MIEANLEIYAYALLILMISAVLTLTLVLHLIPSTELPSASIKLYRLYFILGSIGWIAEAVRSFTGLPIDFSVLALSYIICSLILYMAVSGCAKKHKLKYGVLAIHLLLAIGILVMPDDESKLLVVSIYILGIYPVIALISARLANEQKNIGHAIITLAAFIAFIGGVVQIYVLMAHRDPITAYGIALVASSTGFMLVGIGFLTSVLFNEHKKLTALALRDPLTGLLNRRGMEQSLFSVLGLSERNKLEISAISIDLDHFKKINDTHGHDGGDIVLKTVADQLVRTRRENDVCCRLGGEEFVLVLPSTPISNAAKLAECIRMDLQMLEIQFDHMAVPVTASLGVASQKGSLDLNTLLKDADKALYQAKELGRNRVVVAS